MPASLQQPGLTIVVVEDHDDLRSLTVQALTESGHLAKGLASAEELHDLHHHGSIDIFLLDLNLPGEDGLSLAKRLRKAFPLVGIIMATARSDLKDRVAGYAHGADIYLGKPFEVEELLAAVSALGRRRSAERLVAAGQFSGHYLLNEKSLSIECPKTGLRAALSASEAQLLANLARAPAQRLDVWQLVESLGLVVDSHAKGNLEVRLARLRKKLISQIDAPQNCLESVRPGGYQLCIALQVL
jgi:DNA-binding response OmpR family regulator